MTEKDYTDENGIKRRVVLPPDSDLDPREGIPISMPLDEIFETLPASFVARLTDECWKRGLIKPEDYIRPGAGEMYKAAFRAIIATDFHVLVTRAKEYANSK